MNISMQERFERKVLPWLEDNQCQLWIGSCNSSVKKGNGHGRFRVGDKGELAHRIAYQLYVGSIPDGMQVLHKCDNPRCVNPEHLFLGTQTDNILDMNKKNRAVNLRRDAHGMSKLTSEKVAEIRSLHARGYSDQALAEMFGVTKRTIQNVYQKKNWK